MYPPLDTLKPVAENLWIVDSGPLGSWMRLPIRMTVIRLGSGALWLHSPTRLTPGLLHAKSTRSAPSVISWRRTAPTGCTWKPGSGRTRTRPPGRLQVSATARRSRTPAFASNSDLSDTPPDAWTEEIDQIVVPGGAGFREVAFLHRPTRTLVLTDLIDNLEGDRLPLPTRLFAGLAGALAPNGKAPIYLRMVVKLRRRDAAAAAARMIAWEPARVIFAHGRWFDRDGSTRLRRSLSWLVDA